MSVSWLTGLMYRTALLAVAGHPISEQILPLLHMALLCSQPHKLLEHVWHMCVHLYFQASSAAFNQYLWGCRAT